MVLLRSSVAIVRVQNSVHDAVRSAMELANWKQYLQPSMPTALKVNLGWDLFIPGSITSPWVIEAVIQTIRDYVGALYLVEADQVLENIEKAFRKCRLPEICDRYDVKWINMTSQPMERVKVPGGRIFQEIDVPRILRETQLITIPVMKTHAKTQVSGAIKNQWGCISVLRHKHHLVLDDALADINTVIRPAFAVMDATVALEGNGPKSGTPRIVDKILASGDIVAIDSVMATLMGLDPERIPHVKNSADRGIGQCNKEQIDVAGEPEVIQHKEAFTPAKHNLVSRVEDGLRRSSWKGVVFDTPLFTLMLIGAKFWYLIWCYFFSNKHWQKILQHPLYGKEWSWVRNRKSE